MLSRQAQLTPRHEVVVLIGASAGLGRAVARRFARDGAWLGLLGADPERLEEIKREVESLGGKAVFAVGDPADPAAHEQIADLTEQTFGPIDVWINHAAGAVHASVWALLPDEVRRATEAGYLGVVFGTQTALRRMRARDAGVILQVGSALAYRGAPFQSALAGSTHAVRGFTHAVRAELKQERSRIRLTLVQLPASGGAQPGWVQAGASTPLATGAPADEWEVAANAIWWAAHHRRREVFVGPTTAVAALAGTLLPALGSRLFARRDFGEPQPPRSPTKPDTRWRPAKPLYAARSLDADGQSLELTVSKRRSAWLWAFVGMAGAVAFAWRRKNVSRAPAWSRR